MVSRSVIEGLLSMSNAVAWSRAGVHDALAAAWAAEATPKLFLPSLPLVLAHPPTEVDMEIVGVLVVREAVGSEVAFVVTEAATVVEEALAMVVVRTALLRQTPRAALVGDRVGMVGMMTAATEATVAVVVVAA